MNDNPIAEIKDALDLLETGFGGMCKIFRIPKDVATRILDLSWEDFNSLLFDGLTREEWRTCQELRSTIGANALSRVDCNSTTDAPVGFFERPGLTLRPKLFVAVGGEYAIWDGAAWRTEADLPHDDEE